MKVAYICISHKPIDIKTTGGLETFSIYLLNALTKLGCEVSLFAASETDISLFPGIKFIPTFSLKDLAKSEGENLESKQFTLNYSMFQYSGFAKAYLRENDFDIFHFSCAQWYVPFLLNKGDRNNIVSTVHVNNLKPETMKYLLNNFSGPHIANISNSSGGIFMDYQNRKTVYNGIDVVNFPFVSKSDNYFAWLGRIAPVKGLKEAVMAAKLADVEFVASGPIDFVDYFEKEVRPLLDDKRKLIEPFDFKTKCKFLGKAKAVLMPVNWEEPFGLVAIEAMVCGTPVIAFRRGGLKETIIDGVTGYLVDTVEEMAEKIKYVDRIDRRACRQHVEDNFSSLVMAKNYMKYYEDIVNVKL